MSITPSQWIENMGAGWNLGNTFECLSLSIANVKWRYWCAKGNWNYSIQHNGVSISANTIAPIPKGVATACKIAFTAPSDSDVVGIILRHPIIETSVVDIPFTITSLKVNNTAVTPTLNRVVFPAFVDFKSTLSNVDLSTIVGESVVGKNIEITLLIDRESLPQYPTNDETVLSNIRAYWASYSISAWGTPVPREQHIKAVAAVGFKSVRIPITWLERVDIIDDNGNVHVDTEFLDYLSNTISWCHKYGLSVVINMHHDDADWLKTGVYLTDPTVSTRYKSIWSQVADYFKDYGDWLAFASNNETRNNDGVWEGAAVTKYDQFGLMQMQKDFYDAVRTSGGNNATRICIYPVYAAKNQYLNAAFENPNDSSDKGIWHLPYNDEYGIAETHPYANTVEAEQTNTKAAKTKALNRGIPVVFGEFGVNASQTHDKQTCINQAYLAAYAKYYGIGTYLWDDGGGMQMLKRQSCTMNNSYKFDKLWNGAEFDFIPSLVESATLKPVEVLLNNRRDSCYVGDTVSIRLDTDKSVIISNEGSGRVALNGNSFIAGSEGVIDNLLAISYNGEYGLIDVTVEMPQNWILKKYDKNDTWQHVMYSPYPTDRFASYASNNAYSVLIPITSTCTTIQGNNTTYPPGKPVPKMKFIQADANNYLIPFSNGEYYLDMDANSEPEILSPRCTQLAAVISAGGSLVDIPIAGGTWVKVNARDFSQTEEKDLTDSYVDSIMDYSNFNASLYRTINVSGGMEYQLDLGEIDCDVYIREFNGEKLEAEYWLKNGDKFTTNLFTKSLRLDIVVPNSNIGEVITAMNNGSLRPTLSYTDYAIHQSKYDEKFTPIPLADMTNRVVGVGNRLLSRNGKVIKL